MRFHVFAALIVVVASFSLGISKTEWSIILLCIGLVIGFELLNTSIEKLSNFVTMEDQPLIKETKDIAAAAVLISAIVSAVIALIIFLPKI